MEFRNILEVGLAPLAAEKATRQDLDAMKQAIDAHKRGLETDGIVYDADIAFHKAIAEASKNSIAMTVLELISGPLFEQRRMTNAFPESARQGLREHVGLFKAIRDHKPDRARTLMRAHMRTAEHYWRLAKVSRNGAPVGGNVVNGDRKASIR
jgi:GntR family transcriptional repressor for pyruvate dehydrogenase complex